MRISTAYQYDSFQNSVETAFSNLNQAQQQVDTGKSINSLSDNPGALASVLKLDSVQSSISQYTTNLNYANSVLSLSDQSLQQMGNLLNQAYSLAVQGANGTNDQNARDGIISQVQQIQQEVVSLANSQGPNGQYLFAGQKTSAAPYAVSGTTLKYSGDANSVLVAIGPSQTLNVSPQTAQTFTAAYASLQDLVQNLQTGNTSAISSNDVSGLQTAVNSVSLMQGNIGSQIQTVQGMLTDYGQRSTELTQAVSGLQNVNMAQAITSYQEAQAAYQAALTVAAQGFQLGLANYIK